MLLSVLCEAARGRDLSGTGIAMLTVMVLQMYCIGLGNIRLGRVEWGRELALNLNTTRTKGI